MKPTARRRLMYRLTMASIVNWLLPLVLLCGCGTAQTTQSPSNTQQSSQEQIPPTASPDSSSAPPSQAPAQDQPAQDQAAQDQAASSKPSAAAGWNPSRPAPDASTTKTQNPSDQKAPSAEKGKVAGTSNDRLFFALPNFLSVESAGKLPPLTTKQKFAVVARGSFDKVAVPWYGLISAIGQTQDSEPAYGQGWGAYGKRFVTNFADGAIENFVTAAVLPSMLKQDPRFYQSGEGSFTRRVFYAASRNFVGRSDSGKKEFNYSEIFGGALSAGISTYSYHPRSTFISTPTNPHKFISSDRTLENTASVWGTQLSYDTITIVIKEFWPDIHRKASKKPKAVPTSAEDGTAH